MSETLLPCPFCGGSDCRTYKFTPDAIFKCWGVWCACSAKVTGFETEQDAIAAWNRRAQPENNPLSLDELRQMDGEPVYTVGVGANRTKRYWCLVMLARKSVCAVIGDEMVCVGAFCQYSETWLAYRMKPERSEG